MKHASEPEDGLPSLRQPGNDQLGTVWDLDDDSYALLLKIIVSSLSLSPVLHAAAGVTAVSPLSLSSFVLLGSWSFPAERVW